MVVTSQRDSRATRHELAAAKDTRRWMLNRGGIINVYQYGDETLDFGGGRLLLRGVNGSGKSTAMNMLLPFLLDADTRRIDAAGEQMGVLKGWMLSGRDEPQPQGYLWLEVVKGDAYFSFGCGIRANRATDQVTTWWFITSRRPGIDLHLVEGRVPLSREALRTAIEPDLVYGHEQRTAYREELRKRLFGGADIEQHLHLLRIVRNPRVGDRLDTELPQYLQDALPQLSEAALDDAAQPLEDLEEHRKNVADLKRTAEVLDAVYATYRNYARTELQALTHRTLGAARTSRDCRRDEEKAGTEYTEALDRHRAAETRHRDLESSLETLRSAIAALKDSEAYKSGSQLNDLREHVESLKRAAMAAEQDLQRRRAATQRAAHAVQDARQDIAADHEALRQRLSDLASLAAACRLIARPPGVPPITAHPSSPADLQLAPEAPVDTAAADAALPALGAAARQRIEEVAVVESAVQAIEPAERALREAERAVGDAQAANDGARQILTDARTAFQSAIESWQAAVAQWTESMRCHRAAHDIHEREAAVEPDAVAEEIILGRRAGAPLEASIAAIIRHHEGRRAEREALLQQQHEIVAEIEQRAAELAAKQLPDPPGLGWQKRAVRCFAELVDFAEHVDGAARASLEAALEASGLLVAEVQADGVLKLANGQLVIASDTAGVSAPLSGLLRAQVPEGAGFIAGFMSVHGAVERILRAISTDWTANADTVVTVDGEFRIGALRGKHAKPEAEHIGVTARRAALERQRAENALALTQARGHRDRLVADVEIARAALDEAQALRTQIPSDQGLHTALWQRNEAERAVERAMEQLRARRSEFEAAEQQCAEAVAHARATAARLSLPAVLDELRGIRADLERILRDSREAQRELTQLVRSVGRWRERSEDWRAAHVDEVTSDERRTSVAGELSAAQERLTTLDTMIGAAYQEVIGAIARNTEQLNATLELRNAAEREREQAVRDVTAAEKNRESAAAARERADAECLQALGVLRQALAIPGLVEAAADVPEQTRSADAASADAGIVAFPVVEDTPAGARQLADAIRAKVPKAEEPVTPDGVRQSIRRRRDLLGAGWDAEDRQPDEHLPLHIEVTGPLAQQTPLPAATWIVQRQLATMTNLLSAKQHQALRNLLQGLVAREVADKLHAAGELIERMNKRLSTIATSHGIGVRLRWQRRDDLDPALAGTINLLAKPPDLRTADEDRELSEVLGRRIDDAHREDPGTPYRDLIARVLDYREWHRMTLMLLRPGCAPERLSRRTALSEGEKKVVSYVPLFAAVAASCDGLGAIAAHALRFVLLDDAFAKVSEDNHPKLFGLLVELDLDFIATSERLWGTHDTVPDLAITEVIRDAGLQTIVLEHYRWNARRGELTR